jgi:23S rRNA (adenine2503-C2)-methyltransferase
MKIIKDKQFINGKVFCMELDDGRLIETTDTFLPYDTINCIYNIPLSEASRLDRWMIGVSVMSGCPVGCKFCATGNMKKFRNLSSSEIFGAIFLNSF